MRPRLRPRAPRRAALCAPPAQRKEQNLKIVTDAVLSLIQTDAVYDGQRRALEILRDEMAAPGANIDAEQMQQRLRELAEKESAKRVERLGDCRATPLFQSYTRGAKLQADDDEDGVQMTQDFAPGDLLCPLMRTLYEQPTKIKPCFQVGSTRCVFSKAAILNHVNQNSRTGMKCPMVGCAYQGMVRASDLEPCKETELMVKRALQQQEREKIRLAAENQEEDEDALDEDPVI